MKWYSILLIALSTTFVSAKVVVVSSSSDFAQKISQGDVLVDFYADWCGPCKKLGPSIEQLSQELPQVTFLKVNVDGQQLIARNYGIRSIPALMFFSSGTKKWEHFGFMSKSELKNMLLSLI